MREPASEWRAKRALQGAVALVLLGLISHGTFAGTGDEPHYLAITHSLAFDGDFDLSNNYGASEPLIAAGELQPENHVRAGVGGVVRPIHDVGMPILFAPAVRILRPVAAWLAGTVPERAMQRAKLTPTVLYRHTISILMIVVATAMAGLLFDTLIGLGATTRAAFAGTLLVSLSPPLLIHSVLYFTETLTAFLCLWVLTRVRGIGGPRERGIAGSGYLLIGAAIGFLMLVHARNAGFVLAFTALGMRAAWRDGGRSVAAFVGGLAALLAVRTAINVTFWGTLVTTPHAALGAFAPADLLREVSTRLGGLLFDQEFGLLIYAPIYLLAIVGLVASPNRPVAQRVAFVAGCYLVPVLLPITNVHGWTGGWSPAARFMVPLIPLLALTLPWTLQHTPRIVLAVLLTLQLAIDAYMWQNPKNLWNDGDGTAAVCARSSLAICRYLPSFVR